MIKFQDVVHNNKDGHVGVENKEWKTVDILPNNLKFYRIIRSSAFRYLIEKRDSIDST